MGMRSFTKISAISLVGGVVAIVALGASDMAAALTTSATNTTNNSSGLTATQQKVHLQRIINRGDREIERRLGILSKLSTEINASTKLSASDKAYLTTEVTGETTGLTNLKSTLDKETTLTAAKTDVQDIYTEYRVFYLVVPKVWLVKTADDQQITESNLTVLAQKLQTRINTAKASGKDVTTLQNQLDDMTKQISNAQAISSGIEQKVLPLQPTDFNNDHAILDGDWAQLKTAHADNLVAYNDAKSIVSALQHL